MQLFIFIQKGIKIRRDTKTLKQRILAYFL